VRTIAQTSHQSDEIQHLITMGEAALGRLPLGEGADSKSFRVMLYCAKCVWYLAASSRLTQGLTDGS